MRILQTSHTYSPEMTGVAQVVGNLAVRFAERGHDSNVATAQVGRSAREETIDGVHVRRFRCSGNAVRGIRGETREYVQHVREGGWDVVVTHCAQTWNTDVLLPELPLASPAVVVGHGLSAWNDPAYAEYFDGFAAALRHAAAFATLSGRLEEVELCRLHGLPDPVVIGNGVDVEEFAKPLRDVRRRWSIGTAPWVLNVSNHAPAKDHGSFFELWREVSRRVPGSRSTLVGSPHPAARWGLGRIGVKGGCWYRCRSRAPFARRLSLVAGADRRDVVSAMREADVLVLSSTREASPIVLLESMAAGTPWVAFDVGAVGENAGGVAVGTPDEMLDAVLELLASEERRRTLADAGLARVASRHAWERVADAHLELYRSVCLPIA
jgi:glycosyltransferase involved in cell wall biosynthesis